jgi:AcrR family transcriptional regulator
MPDLRSERGKATRERLIAAGRELFGERGYEATSIEAILEGAGVKRGALYHHFESKHALFDAVLDRVVSDVAKAVAEAARAETDALERLRAGCAAWLRMALDPAIQRIALLDPPAVVGWTRWRELDEQHFLGGVRRNLQLIAADKRLPPGDVDLLAHMLLAAVNEAALLIARSDNPRDALAKGQAAVDTLLGRLVAARPEPQATSEETGSAPASSGSLSSLADQGEGAAPR